MPIYKRAAQFAPFAALAGYSEEIQEAHRITEARKEVDEHTAGILNERLRILQSMDKPLVTVTYFVKDKRKPGGEYITVTGAVRWIDPYARCIVFCSGARVPIDDIYNIIGEMFQ